MTLQELIEMVAQAGYRPSLASWEDDEAAYAFSIEGDCSRYGHPSFVASFNKRTGWLDIETEVKTISRKLNIPGL